MNRPYLLFILASTALVSCTAVGPDYTPPKTPLETSFIGGGGALEEVARDEWWKRLNDRQMNRLVDKTSILQRLYNVSKPQIQT